MVALAAAGFWLAPLGARLMTSREPAATAAASFSADSAGVAVVDGATLRLNETVIRLAGVTAPARGVSCHGSDNASFDCGAAATNALNDLVRNRKVDCRVQGRDDAGHTLAVCTAGGQEINRTLIATGWARANSEALTSDEAEAKSQRRGLWAFGAQTSW